MVASAEIAIAAFSHLLRLGTLVHVDHVRSQNPDRPVFMFEEGSSCRDRQKKKREGEYNACNSVFYSRGCEYEMVTWGVRFPHVLDLDLKSMRYA